MSLDVNKGGGFTVVGTPVKNDAVLYNGTTPVWAAQGTSFTFSLASYTNSQSGTFRIGTGTWKAIGAISFSASYNNGPATSASIAMSGAGNSWGSTLALASFTGPTTNATRVDYPSGVGSITFTLTASDGTTTVNSNTYATFNNDRFWGLTTLTSGWVSSDIQAIANSDIQNSGSATVSVTVGAGQYFIWASRTALGTRTFKDASTGFQLDMQAPATVSVTNANGFVENYYVYSSTYDNLGSLTIAVT